MLTRLPMRLSSSRVMALMLVTAIHPPATLSSAFGDCWIDVGCRPRIPLTWVDGPFHFSTLRREPDPGLATNGTTLRHIGPLSHCGASGAASGLVSRRAIADDIAATAHGNCER